jgi:hypothetical protein
MVYTFSSNVVDPPVLLYMGKDKYENEELIANGLEEDVWFHVDKLSSAHVYLRLSEGQTINDINENVVIDCAQLTKANSIEGNKKDNIQIVYTPWSNLKKTKSMDVGQVSFFKEKDVKKISLKTRENVIVNRLNKTKKEILTEDFVDQNRSIRKQKKVDLEMKNKKEMESQMKIIEEARKMKKSYKDLFDEKNMQSNYDGADDDFM